MKKQSDANEYEYNKKPLPTESVRSHVAMDFTGNVGRIVEDPKEALAIAQAEIGSGVRRSWRSTNRHTSAAPIAPNVQVAVTRLDNDIHLSQSWYHKDMTREQAVSILNGVAYKDGWALTRGVVVLLFVLCINNYRNLYIHMVRVFRVFLIRESKSKTGTYVLSYKHSGKVIHVPILAVRIQQLLLFDWRLS